MAIKPWVYSLSIPRISLHTWKICCLASLLNVLLSQRQLDSHLFPFLSWVICCVFRLMWMLVQSSFYGTLIIFLASVTSHASVFFVTSPWVIYSLFFFIPYIMYHIYPLFICIFLVKRWCFVALVVVALYFSFYLICSIHVYYVHQQSHTYTHIYTHLHSQDQPTMYVPVEFCNDSGEGPLGSPLWQI